MEGAGVARIHGEPDNLQYNTRGLPHFPEDIVFCIDIDRQVDCDMKTSGSKGQTISRLDAIRQAILLFVHSKLLMYPYHRFAISTMGNTAAWHRKELSNDVDIIGTWLRTLSSGGLFLHCDLASLLQMVLPEAKASRTLNRCFRVIFIYCRSDIVPEFEIRWPHNQRLFTFDALYLHDKPSRENCPQTVYDTLVEVLEKVTLNEGYIYESGSGFARLLFKQTCLLLSHPQQRCLQDDFDAPRDLSKTGHSAEASSIAIVSTRKDEDII